MTSSTPFEIFQTVMNRFATQKGCNFETTDNEKKAFLEITNKLLSLEDYWSTDKFIENAKIQNGMTRTRFQSILQNLHFSSNNNHDETNKSYKIRRVIEHLNKVFAENLSNSLFQSVEKHMHKFKGRLSMKEYTKNK